MAQQAAGWRSPTGLKPVPPLAGQHFQQVRFEIQTLIKMTFALFQCLDEIPKSNQQGATFYRQEVVLTISSECIEIDKVPIN